MYYNDDNLTIDSNCGKVRINKNWRIMMHKNTRACISMYTIKESPESITPSNSKPFVSVRSKEIVRQTGLKGDEKARGQERPSRKSVVNLNSDGGWNAEQMCPWYIYIYVRDGVIDEMSQARCQLRLTERHATLLGCRQCYRIRCTHLGCLRRKEICSFKYTMTIYNFF